MAHIPLFSTRPFYCSLLFCIFIAVFIPLCFSDLAHNLCGSHSFTSRLHGLKFIFPDSYPTITQEFLRNVLGYPNSAIPHMAMPSQSQSQIGDSDGNYRSPQALDPPSTTLDVSSEGGTEFSLDALGPMVVNVDGSVSRITNWDKMTDTEKKTTLRVFTRRNKVRLDALKEQELEELGK